MLKSRSPYGSTVSLYIGYVSTPGPISRVQMAHSYYPGATYAEGVPRWDWGVQRSYEVQSFQFTFIQSDFKAQFKSLYLHEDVPAYLKWEHCFPFI